MRNRLSTRSTRSQKKAHDESLDDFLPERPSQKTTEVSSCPFCQKVFKNVSELKRNAHLKVCGTHSGLKPEDVLKVRRLEEKQAAEWASLGLPKPTTAPKETSKRKPKASNVEETKDAQLEMALALSASMVEQPKPLILPQAASSPQKTKRGSKKCSAAKTCLEVRTKAERDRQVGESVTEILTSCQPKTPNLSDIIHPEKFAFASQQKSEFLRNNLASKNAESLWSLAAQHEWSQYQTDLFKPYVAKQTSKVTEVEEPKVEEIKREEVDPKSILRQFEAYLESAQKLQEGNVKVYLKDEQVLHCHLDFIKSRFPNLLNDAVIEQDKCQSVTILHWDDVDMEIGMEVLRYVYCGSFDFNQIKSQIQSETLKQLCTKFKLQHLLDLFDNQADDQDFKETSTGFIETEEEEVKDATQNLDLFLEEAEISDDQDDEDWQEVHDYLTQKRSLEKTKVDEPSPVKTLESIPEMDSADDDVFAGSPDLFEDDVSEIKRKRSSSKDSLQNVSKRLRFEDEDQVTKSPEIKDANGLMDRPIIDVSDRSLVPEEDGLFCEAVAESKRVSPSSSPVIESSGELMDLPDLEDAKGVDDGCSQVEESEAAKSSSKKSMSFTLSSWEFNDSTNIPKSPALGENDDLQANESHGNQDSRSDQAELNDPIITVSDQSLIPEEDGPLCEPVDESLGFSPINSPKIQSSGELSNLQDLEDEEAFLSKHSLLSPCQGTNQTSKKQTDYIFNISSESEEEELSVAERCLAIKVSLVKGENIKKNLEELQSLSGEITIETLLSSGVGKPVHKLLKSGNLALRQLAQSLVDKWKVLIANENQAPRPVTPVTPRPKFESMLSPALRKELRKYGLKVIPRPKAVTLLHHIYDETHPKRKPEAEKSLSSSQSSQEMEDLPEESIHLNPEGSQLPQEPDLHQEVIKFIQNNPDLHRKCLTYEPIWLEQFFDSFKRHSGRKKLKINQIMDVLDNECITFRTVRNSRNRK